MNDQSTKIASVGDGFTLIEAIIAITIIGIAALPIMALLSQSMDQLLRASEAHARAAATESALAFIDPVNPLLTPEGQSELGEVSVSWESEILVEPNETTQIRSGLAGYSVGFYKVVVTLNRNDEYWFSFETRKAGFERIDAGGSPFEDSR